MSARKVIPMPDAEEPTEETPRLSGEKLRAALAAEKREREQKASTEVDAILKKYHCGFAMRPYITDDGRIAVQTAIVAMTME